MAKYERRLNGNFDEVLRIAHDSINRSMSATLEDQSYANFGDVRVAIRVYERYSWLGGNRVSLNLTLVGEGSNLFLSAISDVLQGKYMGRRELSRNVIKEHGEIRSRKVMLDAGR